MQDWSQGYITNIDYTTHFYPFLAPVAQNLNLVVPGITPVNIAESYTYCELGCGQGFTSALLAAANPRGMFYAVDFNPSHIAGATQLKDRAGLDNLVLLEKSFAELHRLDLPQFDFIAFHGIWSWIDAANRKAILDFIYANLKPGGVVMVSYNALPGWSSMAPLRQLFLESQSHKAVHDIASVQEAMHFAEEMQKHDIGYFHANPAAGSMLESLNRQPKNYVLHEYFNTWWEPFYHSQVASDFSAAKLTYACSADIVEHLDQVCLPDAAIASLAKVQDPNARQTIRDFYRNTRFRRDLYTRGGRRLSAPDRIALLQNVRLALAMPINEFPLQVAVPLGQITVDDEKSRALVAELQRSPATIGELTARIGGPEAEGAQLVFQSILILLAAGRIRPALPDNEAALARARTDHFNAAVQSMSAFAEACVLASPVLGSGLAFPPIETFLGAIRQSGKSVNLQELVSMKRSGQLPPPLHGVSDEQLGEAFTQLGSGYEFQRLPYYKQMGLLRD